MAVQPPAPFTPPLAGSLDQRVTQIAQALSKKSDATLEPVYNAVQLIAPNGAVWRVSVSNAGALVVAVVAR
jgi:hypothetical protein